MKFHLCPNAVQSKGPKNFADAGCREAEKEQEYQSNGLHVTHPDDALDFHKARTFVRSSSSQTRRQDMSGIRGGHLESWCS